MNLWLDLNNKYQIKNNLFTRPVLEYKIECENS